MWTNDTDSPGTAPGRYNREMRRETECDHGGCVAIRTPLTLDRTKQPLHGIIADLRNAGLRRPHRWSETSNPFFDDRDRPRQMAGFRANERDELEHRLDQCGYDWKFVPKAQFRFHPFATAGYYVIFPENWEGEWPDT